MCHFTDVVPAVSASAFTSLSSNTKSFSRYSELSCFLFPQTRLTQLYDAFLMHSVPSLINTEEVNDFALSLRQK